MEKRKIIWYNFFNFFKFGGKRHRQTITESSFGGTRLSHDISNCSLFPSVHDEMFEVRQIVARQRNDLASIMNDVYDETAYQNLTKEYYFFRTLVPFCMEEANR